MNGDIRFVVDFTALETRLTAIEDNQGEILAGQAQLLKAGKTLTATLKRMDEKMTSGFDRLGASYEGIAGDIAGLKAAAEAQNAAIDQLKAGQDAAVLAGVEAAQADFNAKLDAVAARFEGLDAETPAPEPPAA